MESENILAINVPNAISITVMALFGAFILGAILKAAKGNMAGTQQQTFGS